MKNIAIFASGNGSNALRLIEHFRNHAAIKVSCVITNNPNAGVIQKAKDNKIPYYLFTKQQFNDSETLPSLLKELKTDFIVLAGFLLLVHTSIIHEYNDKIINIHPSLLPKYGGKGMYGDNVHKAVLAAGEKETGVTVHLVNEEFDKGEILGKEVIQIDKNETLETLKVKIHEAEHRLLPKIVEKTILN